MCRAWFDFSTQSNSAGSAISCTAMETRRMPPLTGSPSWAAAGATRSSPRISPAMA